MMRVDSEVTEEMPMHRLSFIGEQMLEAMAECRHSRSKHRNLYYVAPKAIA